MKLADEVPYDWWERNPRNPWYDRETRKVVLPDALKDKRNIMMKLDEMKEYAVLLDAMHADVERERNTLRNTVRALEKGYIHSWQYPEICKLFHLCRALEFMVTMAKHKKAMMLFFVAFTKRAVDAQKGEEV